MYSQSNNRFENGDRKFKRLSYAVLGGFFLCLFVFTLAISTETLVGSRNILNNLKFSNEILASAKSAEEMAAIRLQSQRYWDCQPDVAADRFFGRNGPMGFLGAYEHYQRHGKREGRYWPKKNAKKQKDKSGGTSFELEAEDSKPSSCS